jgi:hypothetical protein
MLFYYTGISKSSLLQHLKYLADYEIQVIKRQKLSGHGRSLLMFFLRIDLLLLINQFRKSN